MARRSCTELRPARMAPPAPGGPPLEGPMRRKEMTMTTTMTMTELREVDPDEMAGVDGGFAGGGCGYINPSPLPPGSILGGPPPVAHS
jgi:hypothetical protein